jgi:type II secretory pathway component PulF
VDAKKLPPNIIKIKKIKNLRDYFNITFSSYDDVVDTFKELSMILDTHISLNEALTILLQSSENKKVNDVLTTMQIAIQNGQSISKALEQHTKYIGYLPVLFFNIVDNNGNIKDTVRTLCTVLVESQKAKKKFLQALSYPIVLLISLVFSLIVIFNFVIPKFEHIFIQYGSNLPTATKYLLNLREFLSEYYIVLIVLIITLIVSIKYFYKNNKMYFDKMIVLYIPVISSLYKNFLLYRFFLTLNMLVHSHYKFQYGLKSVKPIIRNEFVVNKIDKAIYDIENGLTISEAFKNRSFFDDITIRLLNIAQTTDTIPDSLNSIVNIYKQNLDKNIKYFSSAIGPIFIFFIATFILWLVFALMLPIWDIGTVLN